jgi:site-specific recombinase XerD
VLPVLGESRLDIITTADVERFLDALTSGERAIAPATRNRYRDLLSGMFKRAVRLGLLASNPVKGIPKVKEAGGRVLYLPPATKDRAAHEEAALTKALPVDMRPLFLVSIHTGLRWSEQSALRWQDVDVLSATLTVTRSKNGHQRTVPMNGAVRSVFLDASLNRKRTDEPDEQVFPMAYRTVARAFDRSVKVAQAALRDAGKDASLLEGFTWHSNRHTFASRLVMAGVDLLSVQRLGGWRTVSMVQRYAHLAPDHLRAAVERLTVAELGVNLDSTPSADTARV